MKITKIEDLHCDAGWRPWTFIKISTDEGLVGWSECSDSHGSPRGLEGVIKDLSQLLIGKDPRQVDKLYWLMYSRTRQSPGSIIQKGIGGIENALLDIKAKSLGVPVYELFGGPLRETIPLYWSHFATSRVRDAAAIGKPQMILLCLYAQTNEEMNYSERFLKILQILRQRALSTVREVTGKIRRLLKICDCIWEYLCKVKGDGWS